MVDDKITLSINAEELLQELEEVETKANKVETVVETVKKGSELSFNEVMGMVHAGWLATQGMIRAAGGSISTVFRTVVGTTLGAVATLSPLFAAQAAAGDFVRAAMGMASIGISLSALAAMEAGQKDLSDQLRGANMALHGIQAMIGNYSL